MDHGHGFSVAEVGGAFGHDRVQGFAFGADSDLVGENVRDGDGARGDGLAVGVQGEERSGGVIRRGDGLDG